jgi:hypothetical protein
VHVPVYQRERDYEHEDEAERRYYICKHRKGYDHQHDYAEEGFVQRGREERSAERHNKNIRVIAERIRNCQERRQRQHRVHEVRICPYNEQLVL